MPVTPTYVLLNQVALAAASSSITFSSIPQNYCDLVLVAQTRNTAYAAPYNQYRIRVNGDTGANYNDVRMIGDGSGTGSAAATNATEHTIFFTEPNSASNYGVTISQFMDYSAIDKHKTILSRNDAPSQSLTSAYAARWANTAAITSISIFPPPGYGSWATGSTFLLYGLVA